MLREEEIDRNPMDGAEAPIVPDQPLPVLELDQLRALVDSCRGNSFVDRRDNAILRLLADTGGRLSELAGAEGGSCHRRKLTFFQEMETYAQSKGIALEIVEIP